MRTHVVCGASLVRCGLALLVGSFSVARAASPSVNVSPASTQTITVGQSIVFQSTATDADGDLQVHRIYWQDPEGRWSWQEGSGANGLSLSGPADVWFGGTASSTRSITVTASRTGTFIVQWGAADPNGWVDSSAVTLIVNAANTPPSVTISPAANRTIALGSSFVTSSDASDPDGNLQAHSLSWQDPDGHWSWEGTATGLNLNGDATWWSGGSSSSSRTLTATPTRAGTFRVMWSALDPAGWVDTASYTVTVSADTRPTVTISPSTTVTTQVNQVVAFDSTANDPNGDMQAHSFSWQDPAGHWDWEGNASGITLQDPKDAWLGAASTSTRTMHLTASVAGTYHVRWSALDANGWTDTADVTLIVQPPVGQPPTITTQPQSQSAAPGATVTFTVTASGSTPLNYQWRKDNANVGTNSATLTLANVQTQDAGTYDVIVSNGAGSKQSNPATLTVTTNPRPQITIQPSSTVTIAAGDTTTFGSTATDSGGDIQAHSFSWRDPAGHWNWESGGATGLTLLDPAEVWVNGVASSTRSMRVRGDQPGTYTVRWSALDANGWTDGPEVTLIVGNGPPVIAQQPQSRTVPLNSSVTFSVAVSGNPPLSYQWSKDGAPLSGKTDATLTINSVQNTDVGSYTVFVSNPQGNKTSDPATLAIGQPPQPPSDTYAEADYANLMPPRPGAETMHILTTQLLELVHISHVTAPNAAPDSWNWGANGQYSGPAAGDITVTWSGGSATVSQVGFRRRTLTAPRKSLDQAKSFNATDGPFDFSVTNHLFLKLDREVPEDRNLEITVSFTRDNQTWVFKAKSDPMRFNPALHVNQEGYMPGAGWPKLAYVGYYLGDMGELTPPGLAFDVIDANGNAVASGQLSPRHEVGANAQPVWYNQKVWEADFTSNHAQLTNGALYRLRVDKMGVSFPFRIGPVAWTFARTYALGLYHQRCGTALITPFTRFTHEICHDDDVYIPWDNTAASGHERDAFHSAGLHTLTQAWDLVTSHIETDAPRTSSIVPYEVGRADQTLALPFVKFGTTSLAKHGHHDAGDYSRYTSNSATLLHYLLFAADNLPGVNALDNLGTPRDTTTAHEVLRAAKWEADFLAGVAEQDQSNNNAYGFYYLVYPRYGEYEGGPPNNGVEQVVWPKQSAVTAAGIAALLQAANSTAFANAYPAEAARYRTIALTSWTYLKSKIEFYGGDYGGQETGTDRMRPSSAYQYVQHFGNEFADVDDLAWAMCELYLETHDLWYAEKMKQLYKPILQRDAGGDFRQDTYNGATLADGYRHMSASFGNAARSYVFAKVQNRLPADAPAGYFEDLVDEIYKAADDLLVWSDRSAYRLNFPDAAKPEGKIGWYFAGSWAFDLAVGDALSQARNDGKVSRTAAIKALVSTMNYEAGANPVNVAMVTGIGRKRQNVLVNQYADSDHRLMPPTGIPVGTVRQRTVLYSLNNYQIAQNAMPYPAENLAGGYALYDRWSDNGNEAAESSTVDIGRGLAAYAYLAAIAGGSGDWYPTAEGTISGPPNVSPGQEATFTFTPPQGFPDDDTVTVVWETARGIAGFGRTFKFTPDTAYAPAANTPVPWLEAEAMAPDGRRAVAAYPRTKPMIRIDRNQSTGNKVVLTRDRTGTEMDVILKITTNGRNDGTDYQVNSIAHFDATASTVDVNVNPIANGTNRHPLTVRVSLDYWRWQDGTIVTHYIIGSPGGATVTVFP